MSKRVIKVRNALTGVVREIRLPGKPAPKRAPSKDLKVHEGGIAKKATSDDSGEGVGADLG